LAFFLNSVSEIFWWLDCQKRKNPLHFSEFLLNLKRKSPIGANLPYMNWFADNKAEL
jgi:hypothetical protein